MYALLLPIKSAHSPVPKKKALHHRSASGIARMIPGCRFQQSLQSAQSPPGPGMIGRPAGVWAGRPGDNGNTVRMPDDASLSASPMSDAMALIVRPCLHACRMMARFSPSVTGKGQYPYAGPSLIRALMRRRESLPALWGRLIRRGIMQGLQGPGA
jgi:hypothetical protein